MRRFACMLVCLALLAMGCANADTNLDLAGLGLSELIALQQEIQAAMWASDEWQEVEVPVGIYEIGVDIPEGHWTISGNDFAYVTWGQNCDPYGATIEYSDKIADEYLERGDIESISWNLTAGTYLCVECSSVVFTPYAGTSLGFKF